MKLIHLSRKDRWEGIKPISRITNNDGIMKPKGVLWTSPEIKQGTLTTSDWINWCRVNNFYDSDKEYIKVTLSADGTANIYDVKCLQTYKQLSAECPDNRPTGMSFLYNHLTPVDWKAVAEKYDGVRISGKALGLRILSAWDVDSVAFFNTEYLSVENIADVELESHLNGANAHNG